MNIKVVPFFLTFSLVFHSLAFSLTVTPLSVSIYTSGSNNSGSLTVTNDRDEQMPVTVQMLRIEASGDIVNEDDLILAFPPQFVLAPGASQVIRFQWLGDPNIQKTQAFYALIQEVPVEIEPDPNYKAGIGEPANAVLDFAVNFQIAVLISPEGAEPDLKIERVESEKTAEGVDLINLVVRNSGNGFGRLRQREIILTNSDGKAAILGSSDMPVQDGVLRTLVLPETVRTVSFPAPDSSWSSGVTAEIR